MNSEVVKAGKSESVLSELWQYRQLLLFFTWREFKLRYKQTYLGALWIVLQPLMFAAIISIVLLRRGELKFGFEGASDVVVIFLGFSLWQFFEAAWSGSIKGIEANKNLAKKIYVPSIIYVLSPVFSRFTDLALKVTVFTFLVIVTGSQINLWGYAALILACAILSLIAIGSGLLLSPINVRFKDVSLTIPFFSRMMFFTAPIWYPFTLIPEEYRELFLLNPIVSCMELMRNAFFDPSAVTPSLLFTPLLQAVGLVVVGTIFFKKTKQLVADYF